jgi:hypothetical protein
MAGTAKPSYGTPNWDLIKGWFALSESDDGPFWALNLMKYRAVAGYADGNPAGVSGKEADDAYAPLGPLAAVGAVVAFHGDVLDQRAGAPEWDRIGIVRYPTRAAFFAMQQRDDFKDQHVHKEAGMEFTIVMACLPDGPAAEPTGDRVVLLVDRGGPATIEADGVTPAATFAVEGVIVGDDRTFDHVRFFGVRDDAALAELAAVAEDSDEAHLLVVERAIDRLADTVATAGSA